MDERSIDDVSIPQDNVNDVWCGRVVGDGVVGTCRLGCDTHGRKPTQEEKERSSESWKESQLKIY